MPHSCFKLKILESIRFHQIHLSDGHKNTLFNLYKKILMFNIFLFIHYILENIHIVYCFLYIIVGYRYFFIGPFSLSMPLLKIETQQHMIANLFDITDCFFFTNSLPL